MEHIVSLALANAASAIGLAVLAIIFCALVRRPEFAHKAWLLVLLKLVAPPLLLLPIVPTSLFGLVAEPETHAISQHRESAIGANESDNKQRPSDISAETNDIATAPATLTEPDDAKSANALQSSPTAQRTAGPDARSWILMSWAIGAVGYWLIVIAGIMRFERRLRVAGPPPLETRDLAVKVAKRLRIRRLPEVFLFDVNLSPMVWASFGRCRVILPNLLWNRLTTPQRESILAHELAHVFRGDQWLRRLEVLILGVYWWFPVAWFARSRLRRAEEACCDARVLRAFPELAQVYAEALIETAAFVRSPARMPMASGGSATAQELKRRLTMILSNKPSRAPRRTVGALLLVAAATLLMLRPGFAQSPPPTTSDSAGGQPTQPDDSQPATPSTGSLRLFYSLNDQAKPTTMPATTTQSAQGRADIQHLKDEVEMLEAQRGTKMSQLTLARLAVEAAERNLGLYSKLSDAKQISPLEMNKAEDERNLARGKLAVQEAELNEHQVKLKQAKRRLDATTKATSATGTPATSVTGSGTTLNRMLYERAKTGEGSSATTTPAEKRPNEKRLEEFLHDARRELFQLNVAEQDLQGQLDAVRQKLDALRGQEEGIMKRKTDVEKKIADLTEKFPKPSK